MLIHSIRTQGPEYLGQLGCDLQSLVQERKDIGGFFDFLRDRLAESVSSLRINSDQYGVFLIFAVLDGVMQCCDKFQRMQGRDSVVMVRRKNKSRRVLFFVATRFLDIMQRRVTNQILEMFFFVGATEV